MKLFVSCLASLLPLVLGAPSPQDPNDDAEILPGGAVSTNDPDTYDYFGDYPGFPGIFGGGFGRPRPRPRVRVMVIPVSDVSVGSPSFGFNDLFKNLFGFGSPRESSENPEVTVEADDSSCGPMCTLLVELLEGHQRGFQDYIDDARDRENEIDGDYFDDEEGFDVNNSTHTTKVLPDGSVVHINKTTISDRDEDGNTFFFHHSVIHSYDGNTENDSQDEDAEEDVPEEDAMEEEDPEEDVVEDEIDEAGEEEDNTRLIVSETGVDEGLTS